MDTNPKCPKCGGEITRGEPRCAHCGVVLRWRSPRQKAEPKQEPASVAPPADNPAAKFCTKCGGKLEPGQKFCPECGAPAAGSPAGKDRKIKLNMSSLPGRGSPDGAKYAAALQMSRDVESMAVNGNVSGEMLFGEFFGLLFLGAFFHEIWVFMGVFVVAECVAAVQRSGVRSLLASQKIAEAQKRLSSSKWWHGVAIFAFCGAMIDFPIRLIVFLKSR